MDHREEIEKSLQFLTPRLVSEIIDNAIVKEIPEGTEILREGQYVKVIPIVINGLIKVFTSKDHRELLIYYIRPNESCVMSFAASLKNDPSRVYATTEEDTLALLLPVDKVSQWTVQFPDINNLFFQQYNMRYVELLDTIHHLLFDNLDKRLYAYLEKRSKFTNKNPISISHREIATELGTAREVISRVMKRLETDGRVTQNAGKIEVLGW